MKKRKTQWHPAFCSAVRLELRADKQILQYTNEYNLNTKPIQIDLLVIKKPTGAVLENEIGKIFKGHNILEYKSPEDAMNVDTYYKTLAYAYLYKASGEKVDAIKADDITVSLVRERKPRELMRYLEENGYRISHPYSGVYYVHKDGFPRTQIIVSKELDREAHRWLTALTSSMVQAEARRLVFDIQTLTEKDDKEYADSVFEVSLKENRKLFETIKKEGSRGMCEALIELMRPELEQAKEEARTKAIAEGRAKGIAEGRAKGRAEGRAEERINTERERMNTERERQRAVAAEKEVQRLKEELRRIEKNRK